MAWHGWPHFASDIDIFPRHFQENAVATISAIEAFGFRSLGITTDDLTSPNQVLQIGAKPNRIDLITSISGVSFDDAWANKVAGSIDGLPVFFIGRLDLIRNKQSTGRPRDLVDAEALKQREPKD